MSLHQFWTDGSSSLVTGQCGWAFVGILNGEQVAAFGHLPGTNQVAELLGITYALKCTPINAEVHILSDSQYSINCATKYRQSWEENGFTTSMGDPVKNVPLIKDLWAQKDKRTVHFHHVKGHSGNPGNEMADAISDVARAVAEKRIDLNQANMQIKTMCRFKTLIYVDENQKMSKLGDVEMSMLPTLYKKNSNGEIQVWTIGTAGSTITTNWGVQNGKIQTTTDEIKEGKNLGKANATTPEQQAEAEAFARWEKQKKKKYVENLDDAQEGKTDALIEGGADCMLAHKFRDHAAKIKFPCFTQPKLDGIRCIAIIKDGKVELWSRTRKRITSMVHIEQALAKLVPVGEMVFDGELYNHDFKAEFEKIVSAVRKEEPSPGCENVQYHIYDLIVDKPFRLRTQMIRQILQGNVGSCLVGVETCEIQTEDEVMEFFDKFVGRGYEGSMLRNSESYYTGKRSYDLQKVKEFDDAEFTIIGVSSGRGKMAGHGIFVCQTADGATFECKMKGDMDVLKEVLANAEKYIGQKLTVQYQGLTNKSSVPRFPVGLRVRMEE